MNNEKQVAELTDQLKAGGVPLSDAAWETALACVGWPYVFGAWGEECTPAGRRKRASDAHPTIVSKCQVLSGTRSSCDGCKWFPDGVRVRMFDCRGFTYWILKQYGIVISGGGATSQWNTESNWLAKGTIDTCPEDVLVCLFVRKGSKMEHTGLGYKGQTCECSNGVQYSKKRDSKWTHWAIPKGVTDKVPEPDPDYRPTLRKGDSGTYVTLLQTQLIQRGYSCGASGADGKFGSGTLAAVKAFQKDNGLAADGVVGKKTWAALQGTEPVKKYTVTIPGLTLGNAEALVSQYANATMKEEI